MAKIQNDEKDIKLSDIVQTREAHLARIARLRLMDDDFFSEALDGKIEAVEFILRVILDRNDLKVIETKAQVEYFMNFL